MKNSVYLNIEDPDSLSFEKLDKLMLTKLKGLQRSYGEDDEIYQTALSDYWDIIRERLLNDYIKYAYKKYRSKESIMDALTQYVVQGKETGITRDNDFREKFKSFLPREVVNGIMGGENAENYVDMVLFNRTPNDKIVIAAARATYEKYGRNQLVLAVEKALNEGSYEGFTNGAENYRTYLEENIPLIEFRSIVAKIIEPTYTQEISRGDQLANYLERLRLKEQIDEAVKKQEEGEGAPRR